jgi:alginate O-acetyltransferase complex protein AlgI
MELLHIFIFGVVAVAYAALVRGRWRSWALMGLSVVALYWLQPDLPIRHLDFILPTATITLAVIGWLVTREQGQRIERADQIAMGLAAALVLALSATRYLNLDTTAWWNPTASRPPETLNVALGLAAVAAIAAALAALRGRRGALTTGAILFIIALFAVLKTEPAAEAVARWLREQTGRDASIASVMDLQWLGFSYVAFRLIHTFRDQQTGKLPALSLRQYLTYVVFFPAITAGPIDRAERHLKDDQALAEMRGFDAARWTEGGARILVGIFKKFVVADSLALFALNATNAAQTDSTAWTWVLLYGYALRLFFDFSGYSDIAIGTGILFGFKLPENFDRPYLKSNITVFWQSWHMTLSNWVRFYVFTPLSRYLMMRERKPPMQVIVLSSQMATMIVIGLWHGVSLNFVVWGAWHGVGLFVHKQWTDRTRKWYRGMKDKPWQRRAVYLASWFITFNFVTVGWVWFALTDAKLAGDVFLRLFGM